MSERDAADRLIAEALDPAPEAAPAPDTPAKKPYWLYRPLQYDPAKEPWERQPRETPDAYAAFIVYRDLGPFGRSINAVARAIGKTRTVPKRWHEQYRWDERAGLWDDAQRRELDGVRKDIQEKAVRDHAGSSRSLIALAVGLLNKQRGDGGINGRELQQAAIALDKGIRHHRLAIGLPTDITQNDQYLKGLLDEAMAVQEQLRLILEENLCESCRETVGAQMRKISERQRRIRERAAI